MLFQTTGPEYEMISLYKAKLGFGIVKFSFVMDLKEVFCAISDLRSVSSLFSLYFSICNIYLFPALVLGAGFAFWLLQFLFIAFLLLLS